MRLSVVSDVFSTDLESFLMKNDCNLHFLCAIATLSNISFITNDLLVDMLYGHFIEWSLAIRRRALPIHVFGRIGNFLRKSTKWW